uniref:G domain-containing protein n=1 Tax=Chromera velia CCMP2878 TaxID=1169474 RepID=A0A0G4HP53_9ALVE|eukprot:Cvel_29673.t1-p1 / transcript=Cvel_29673.t1 / gene=Cvel_29673 / organism=Chromera_velia_CCMP2878 / gene_product=hypothetical protein / transcript_product=hypothetical protein / location=Cvel_scaffold4103:717-3641(+) / protein_length=583 / sequence_SO=supercontig / SO=protein_coding / is_pseudo=false
MSEPGAPDVREMYQGGEMQSDGSAEELRRGSLDFNRSLAEQFPLLRELMKNPQRELKAAESVEVLSKCIEYGFEKAKNAQDAELVVVIGCTGAGKSSAVNYLAGCKMRMGAAKDLLKDSEGDEDYVVVVAAESCRAEVAPIGHSGKSQTFFPEISSWELAGGSFCFCDCPGFDDNRGAEINIANAVNVYQTLKNSLSVRLLVLLECAALHVEKGAGVRKSASTIEQFMGGHGNMEKHKKSIAVAITKLDPGRTKEASRKKVVGHLRHAPDKKGGGLLSDIVEREESFFVIDPAETVEGHLARHECQQLLCNLKPMSKQEVHGQRTTPYGGIREDYIHRFPKDIRTPAGHSLLQERLNDDGAIIIDGPSGEFRACGFRLNYGGAVSSAGGGMGAAAAEECARKTGAFVLQVSRDGNIRFFAGEADPVLWEWIRGCRTSGNKPGFHVFVHEVDPDHRIVRWKKGKPWTFTGNVNISCQIVRVAPAIAEMHKIRNAKKEQTGRSPLCGTAVHQSSTGVFFSTQCHLLDIPVIVLDVDAPRGLQGNLFNLFRRPASWDLEVVILVARRVAPHGPQGEGGALQERIPM